MNLLTKIGMWGLLVGASGSVLHADPPGGWLSPNGVGGSNPAAPADPSAAASAGITASMSAADIQTRVHVLHEQTRADSRHVQYLQQIARKEKDIIKLNCVNDKLVQIKPQMNLADIAETELNSAGDATRVTAFDTVAQAAESIRRLREEADQCIGEAVTQGGESSNSFTAPYTPDDPTKVPGGAKVDAPGFGTQIEAPVYASPFN
jgi:hypothetical protein